MQLRDYTFLGTTRSLCPQCRRLVDAKIIVRDGRVYFRKRCPEHGLIEDFVCSDVAYLRSPRIRPAGAVAAAILWQSIPSKGCPYDCGLCPEHEQHTCIALIEVTSSCNLRSARCASPNRGRAASTSTSPPITRMVDRYVELEGIADVLQISGGEPTLHPELVRMVRYAYEQPDPGGDDQHQRHSPGPRPRPAPNLWPRCAIGSRSICSSTGFDDRINRRLRGEELLEIKAGCPGSFAASTTFAAPWSARSITTPTCTMSAPWSALGLERSWVRGVSFQLASYCGRHVDPEDLEQRATMPDVVKAIVADRPAAFWPKPTSIPCPVPIPTAIMIAYLYRGGRPRCRSIGLIDVTKHMDLIANSIVYTPARARQLAARVPGSGRRLRLRSKRLRLGRDGFRAVLDDFVVRALAEKLSGADVFRVTLTAFLDVHNFDTRQGNEVLSGPRAARAATWCRSARTTPSIAMVTCRCRRWPTVLP